MESNSICKICNKGFANRKALGGHMRSHLAKLPLPSKQLIQQHLNRSLDRSTSSDLESEVLADVKTFSTLNHDEELNETESSELISSSLRRTKRRCRRESEKAAALSESPEQVSSSSVPDFEAANALMMISEGLTNERKRKFENYIDDNDVINEYEDEEDESYNSVTNRVGSKIPKSRYRCDLCNKVFRSHQALGGHKANHKRILEKTQFKEEEGSGSSNMNRRKFRCTFCGREFDSGQALGGHKKVHLAHLGAAYNSHQVAQSERVLLDLNIPAPELLEGEYAN